MTSSVKLTHIERVDWISAIGTDPRDKFAHTFRAKCDMLEKWDYAQVVRVGGEIAAGILVTKSKRHPPVYNLQLLHTFARFRRQGLAKLLVIDEWQIAYDDATSYEHPHYFRVSSEPESVEFYRSLGFKFWGAQKSGTLLSMFRISSPEIGECDYDAQDATIRSALFSGRKGSVTDMYQEPR